MAGVRDHTELNAWKLANELEEQLIPILERPGFRRWPGLRDQLVRSSSSPGPNIAEGFSRYYPKENAPFVRTAKSSLSETIAHLDKARLRQLITKEECETLCRIARRARGAATQYLIYLETAPDPPPGRSKRKAV